MNKLISLLVLLSLFISCQKYDDDPSLRGYTPEAVDDNSWTANIMYEDSIVSGLNPKDSVFIGMPVYEFKNHYKGVILNAEGSRILSKDNQAILIRAVDKDHINIALKNCQLKGSATARKNIVINNIPIVSSADGTMSFTSAEHSLSGTLKGSELRLSAIDDDVHFDYLSTEAYVLDYPQLINGDFETWTFDGDDLPNYWNSYQTAQGKYASLVFMSSNRQVEKSTDVHSGSLGRYSCRIWANQIIALNIPGLLTTGCMNLNSVVSTNPLNYTASQRTASSANPQAMPFVGRPDSIAFWVKFVPQDKVKAVNDTTQAAPSLASFSAFIHGDYDYKLYNDPSYKDEENASHLIAYTTTSISSHDGIWQRISVPFVYLQEADPHYILINFSTTASAGSGVMNDALYIDDIETIYTKRK